MTREEVNRYFSLCPVGSYVQFDFWLESQFKDGVAVGPPHGIAFGILERM
jgi:hypothetical protein